MNSLVDFGKLREDALRKVGGPDLGAFAETGNLWRFPASSEDMLNYVRSMPRVAWYALL